VQRSHALAHPPAGTQRLTPSDVERQRREQHSSPPVHTSPTCFEQEWPSAAVQVESAAHRPAVAPAPRQSPEQQSPSSSHSSPTTRQAPMSAQRSFVQEAEQHCAPPVQLSPAGAQAPPAAAHVWAPVQAALQQSVATLQSAPAEAHGGASWQRDGAPAEPQDSEQHADARSHAAPTGKHPVVGLHVPGPPRAGAQ
jgi:hypothetical protein